MRNIMTKLSTLLVGAALMTASSISLANPPGVCGTGYITEIYGGGWNQDGLIIMFEHQAGSAAPNTFHLNTFRFAPGLTEKRLDMIQGVALLALANGNKVEIYSHNQNAQSEPDCSNATQLRIYRNSTT